VSYENIVSIEGWLSTCTLKEVEAFGYHICFGKVYVEVPFMCFMYFLLELLNWNAYNVHEKIQFWLKVLEEDLRPSTSCQHVGVSEQAVRSASNGLVKHLSTRLEEAS
jgi:hypothetical protein